MGSFIETELNLINSARISDGVTDYIPSEPDDHNEVNGGVLSDTRFSWVSCGPRLTVINNNDGSIRNGWTFGRAQRDSTTKITCVVELPLKNIVSPILIVGCESAISGGAVCFYHTGSSRVLKSIHFNHKVTSVEVVHKDDEPDPHFMKFMTSWSGILAVGTKNGAIYLIDLWRNGLDKCIADYHYRTYDELHFSQLSLVTFEEIDPDFVYRKRTTIQSGSTTTAIFLNDEVLMKQSSFDSKDRKKPLCVLSTVPRDQLVVTAIQFFPQICTLAVGYNIGCFQLWDLSDFTLLYTSTVMDYKLPVCKFALMEPSDDPRYYCYLWCLHQSSGHQQSLPYGAMYILQYNTKENISSCGNFYQDLSSCYVRSTLYFGKEIPLAVDGRIISCRTINKIIPKTVPYSLKDSDSIIEESSLSLVTITWEVWSHNRAQVSNCVTVFDLNQWYQEHMPKNLLCDYDGYMCHLNLKDGEENALLDMRIKEETLKSFVALYHLEQHYYPSSLSFDCVCLYRLDIKHYSRTGVQKACLSAIENGGPTALLNPTSLFQLCDLAGVKPLLVDHVSLLNNSSVKYQREFLLSVALENSMNGFLWQCVQEWSDGSQAVAGSTLPALLSWAWNRVALYKSTADKLCIPLFNFSGHKMDFNDRLNLEHCIRQLHNLSKLFRLVIDKFHNIILKDNIDQQCTALGLVSLYMDLVLWFLRNGILPEVLYDDEAGLYSGLISSSDHVPYIVNRITASTKARREELQQNSLSLRNETSSGLFFIDALIDQECGGSRLINQWELEGGVATMGKYPPPSVQSLLRIYLIKGIPTLYKHYIVLYFILDVINHLDSIRYNEHIEKLLMFPTMFGLTESQSRVIQAFWDLDHKNFEQAVEHLLHANVSKQDLKCYQHRAIMRLLVLEEKHKLALRYLSLKKPPLSDDDDIKFEMNLLLANGLTHEAFSFQRQHQGLQNELLYHFFSKCVEMRTIDIVYKLPLNAVEELAFTKFLELSQHPKGDDLSVYYLVSRSRYMEAIDLHNKLRSVAASRRRLSKPSTPVHPKVSIFGTKDKLASGPPNDYVLTTRDLIINALSKTLPSVTKELVEQCAKEKPALSFSKHVRRPTPLSVVVHTEVTSDRLPRYKTSSSKIMEAALIKTRETWAPLLATPVKSRLKSYVDDVPFLRTPSGRHRFNPAVLNHTLSPVDEKGGKRHRHDDEDHLSKKAKIEPIPTELSKHDFSCSDSLQLVNTPHVPRAVISTTVNVSTPQSILKTQTKKMVETPTSRAVSTPGRSTVAEDNASAKSTPSGRQIRFSIPNDESSLSASDVTPKKPLRLSIISRDLTPANPRLARKSLRNTFSNSSVRFNSNAVENEELQSSSHDSPVSLSPVTSDDVFFSLESSSSSKNTQDQDTSKDVTFKMTKDRNIVHNLEFEIDDSFGTNETEPVQCTNASIGEYEVEDSSSDENELQNVSSNETIKAPGDLLLMAIQNNAEENDATSELITEDLSGETENISDDSENQEVSVTEKSDLNNTLTNFQSPILQISRRSLYETRSLALDESIRASGVVDEKESITTTITDDKENENNPEVNLSLISDDLSFENKEKHKISDYVQIFSTKSENANSVQISDHNKEIESSSVDKTETQISEGKEQQFKELSHNESEFQYYQSFVEPKIKKDSKISPLHSDIISCERVVFGDNNTSVGAEIIIENKNVVVDEKSSGLVKESQRINQLETNSLSNDFVETNENLDFENKDKKFQPQKEDSNAEVRNIDNITNEGIKETEIDNLAFQEEKSALLNRDTPSDIIDNTNPPIIFNQNEFYFGSDLKEMKENLDDSNTQDPLSSNVVKENVSKTDILGKDEENSLSKNVNAECIITEMKTSDVRESYAEECDMSLRLDDSVLDSSSIEGSDHNNVDKESQILDNIVDSVPKTSVSSKLESCSEMKTSHEADLDTVEISVSVDVLKGPESADSSVTVEEVQDMSHIAEASEIEVLQEHDEENPEVKSIQSAYTLKDTNENISPFLQEKEYGEGFSMPESEEGEEEKTYQSLTPVVQEAEIILEPGNTTAEEDFDENQTEFFDEEESDESDVICLDSDSDESPPPPSKTKPNYRDSDSDESPPPPSKTKPKRRVGNQKFEEEYDELYKDLDNEVLDYDEYSHSDKSKEDFDVEDYEEDSDSYYDTESSSSEDIMERSVGETPVKKDRSWKEERQRKKGMLEPSDSEESYSESDKEKFDTSEENIVIEPDSRESLNSVNSMKKIPTASNNDNNLCDSDDERFKSQGKKQDEVCKDNDDIELLENDKEIEDNFKGRIQNDTMEQKHESQIEELGTEGDVVYTIDSKELQSDEMEEEVDSEHGELTNQKNRLKEQEEQNHEDIQEVLENKQDSNSAMKNKEFVAEIKETCYNQNSRNSGLIYENIPSETQKSQESKKEEIEEENKKYECIPDIEMKHDNNIDIPSTSTGIPEAHSDIINKHLQIVKNFFKNSNEQNKKTEIMNKSLENIPADVVLTKEGVNSNIEVNIGSQEFDAENIQISSLLKTVKEIEYQEIDFFKDQKKVKSKQNVVVDFNKCYDEDIVEVSEDIEVTEKTPETITVIGSEELENQDIMEYNISEATNDQQKCIDENNVAVIGSEELENQEICEYEIERQELEKEEIRDNEASKVSDEQQKCFDENKVAVIESQELEKEKIKENKTSEAPGEKKICFDEKKVAVIGNEEPENQEICEYEIERQELGKEEIRDNETSKVSDEQQKCFDEKKVAVIGSEELGIEKVRENENSEVPDEQQKCFDEKKVALIGSEELGIEKVRENETSEVPDEQQKCFDENKVAEIEEIDKETLGEDELNRVGSVHGKENCSEKKVSSMELKSVDELDMITLREKVREKHVETGSLSALKRRSLRRRSYSDCQNLKSKKDVIKKAHRKSVSVTSIIEEPSDSLPFKTQSEHRVRVEVLNSSAEEHLKNSNSDKDSLNESGVMVLPNIDAMENKTSWRSSTSSLHSHISEKSLSEINSIAVEVGSTVSDVNSIHKIYPTESNLNLDQLIPEQQYNIQRRTRSLVRKRLNSLSNIKEIPELLPESEITLFRSASSNDVNIKTENLMCKPLKRRSSSVTTWQEFKKSEESTKNMLGTMSSGSSSCSQMDNVVEDPEVKLSRRKSRIHNLKRLSLTNYRQSLPRRTSVSELDSLEVVTSSDEDEITVKKRLKKTKSIESLQQPATSIDSVISIAGSSQNQSVDQVNAGILENVSDLNIKSNERRETSRSKSVPPKMQCEQLEEILLNSRNLRKRRAASEEIELDTHQKKRSGIQTKKLMIKQQIYLAMPNRRSGRLSSVLKADMEPLEVVESDDEFIYVLPSVSDKNKSENKDKPINMDLRLVNKDTVEEESEQSEMELVLERKTAKKANKLKGVKVNKAKDAKICSEAPKEVYKHSGMKEGSDGDMEMLEQEKDTGNQALPVENSSPKKKQTKNSKKILKSNKQKLVHTVQPGIDETENISSDDEHNEIVDETNRHHIDDNNSSNNKNIETVRSKKTKIGNVNKKKVLKAVNKKNRKRNVKKDANNENPNEKIVLVKNDEIDSTPIKKAKIEDNRTKQKPGSKNKKSSVKKLDVYTNVVEVGIKEAKENEVITTKGDKKLLKNNDEDNINVETIKPKQKRSKKITNIFPEEQIDSHKIIVKTETKVEAKTEKKSKSSSKNIHGNKKQLTTDKAGEVLLKKTKIISDEKEDDRQKETIESGSEKKIEVMQLMDDNDSDASSMTSGSKLRSRSNKKFQSDVLGSTATKRRRSSALSEASSVDSTTLMIDEDFGTPERRLTRSRSVLETSVTPEASQSNIKDEYLSHRRLTRKQLATLSRSMEQSPNLGPLRRLHDSRLEIVSEESEDEDKFNSSASSSNTRSSSKRNQDKLLRNISPARSTRSSSLSRK